MSALAFSFKPQAQRVAPSPLRSLQAGDTFRLHWEGGVHSSGTEGVLLVVNDCRAHVRIRGPKRQASFTDKKGKVHNFAGVEIQEVDWSPGTLVYKTGEDEQVKEQARRRAARKGGPVSENSDEGPEALAQTISLKPSKAHKEDEMAKTQTVPVAKKASAGVMNQKKEVAPKERTNDCLCGCGTKVFKRFSPGHDSRYHGWIKKIGAGEMQFTEIPKPVQKRVGNLAGLKKEDAAGRAEK